MKPVSVLYVMPGLLDADRVTRYVMNCISQMNPERVRVDFIVHGMEKGAREDEARALGCRVYHVPRFLKNPIRNIADTRNVLYYGGHDIVETHMDARNAFLLFAAKRAGVPVRISMSHSVRLPKDAFLYRILHRLSAFFIRNNATHLLARSMLAGRFLYGRGAADAGRVTVFKAAIQPGRYAFDAEARNALRRKLRLEDCYLIGHVGRFEQLENYDFLIDTFSILSRRMPEAVLVLVGSGPLYGDVIRRVRERGVEDRVRLLGFRDDVPELLSAFDCFVLPARGEGLPASVVEAQCSGLPCIVSLAVPTEACVADLTFVPLSDMEAWLGALRSHAGLARRGTHVEPFIECGFDLETEGARRTAFYESAAAEFVPEDAKDESAEALDAAEEPDAPEMYDEPGEYNEPGDFAEIVDSDESEEYESDALNGSDVAEEERDE